MIIDPFRFGVTDPDFSSVISLADFNGANGAGTPFVQLCPTGSAITDNATGALLSSAQSPFGGTSLRCNGAITDYAVGASNAIYTLGTVDVCVELWVRIDNVTAPQIIFDGRPTNTNGVFPTVYQTNGQLFFYQNSADRITSAAGALVANTWYHIAWSRVSGTSRLFVAGTQVGSNYTDSNNYLSPGSPAYRIGMGAYTTGGLTGYVGPFRMTKNAGRYSADFTAPSTFFPTS